MIDYAKRKTVVPNKKGVVNSVYVEAYKTPPISKIDVDVLLMNTVSFIKSQIKVSNNPVISYSAGKDGVVLDFIINSVMNTKMKKFTVISKGLEYDFMSDFTKDCDIIYTDFNIDNTFNDDNFLKTNILGSGFAYYNKKQDKYIRDNDVDMCFYGRRTADSNTVRSKSYKRKDGLIVVNPLKDWTNDELISFIRYYNVKLPLGYFDNDIQMFTYGGDDLLEHFYSRDEWFNNPKLWLDVVKKHNVPLYMKVKKYVKN